MVKKVHKVRRVERDIDEHVRQENTAYREIIRKNLKICDIQDISYSISPNGKSITFKPCGLTSHNPHDVKNKFCARCHRFMDLVDAARKLSKLKRNKTCKTKTKKSR